MPITVRKDVKVTELRKGDTFEETPPAVVESLKRKDIWGAVQITGEAKPRRLRLDASVTVLREEPTEDERDRARRTIMVETLKAEMTGWLRCDPARMLREILDSDRGYGEVLTWSNLPDVLKAQATYKHARTLRYHLGEPDDLAAVNGDTLLEVFAEWWRINIHSVIDHGPRRDPISRSTSAVANLIEDCDDWAVQQIRSRIVWAGAREEMQRRVRQALAARR